jgi:hypothetical protein
MLSFYEHPCGTVSTIAHVLQCVSSIIVLGITAWAVVDTKTLTVIFSLVIVSYMKNNPLLNAHLHCTVCDNAYRLCYYTEHKLHCQ